MESAIELCSDSYHALFSCNGLAAIGNQKLTQSHCAYILRQYQKYVQAFPKFLALGISKLDEDEARLPLVANLWDEHGEGDLTKAHRNLYRDLLAKVLEACPSSASLLKRGYNAAVTKFVAQCESALLAGTAPFAIGFLGPGTEGTTAQLYAILPRLLGPFNLEDDDIFFSPHCQLDVEHIRLFEPAIEIVLRENGNGYDARLAYVAGVDAALRFEREFWDDVIQEAQSI